ncbi:hypothetical protein PHLGIDRAFT_109410 [Phlebiopsis gigantea 11061_1 CR5-6]|uniref:RTA1 like protein n=1 Tax=Phlebiopsis gigantea (strain 11061_1 CR5-6) TaxID=745531 RepID=A0A0C3PFX1_PHLG1|nr:hypothetical protein PHLGIDRAFT_109410 [Phlebiopsis gigantea 11061_1 CR5-6]
MGVYTIWPLRSNPDSITLYAIYNFFATLSPCGFIAAEYVLLGWLARWLNADCHLLIPPSKITLVFVLSDVSTFLTQAAGGGISASGGSNASMGAKIVLVGLILQLVLFVFFTLVFARFIHRVYNYEPSIWSRDRNEKWYNNWRTLALIMFISQIGVIVRSVYRCIELSEGHAGPFTRTEIYLFVLDLAPLLVAIGVYIPFWPGRFTPNGLPERRPDFEEVPFGFSDAIGVDGSPVFMRTKA